MLTIAHYAVYLALRLVEGLLKVLPLDACCVIGEVAGWIFFLVSPGYRRLVLNNIRIAFEDELSEKEMRALRRRHFYMLGRNIGASIKIAMMPPEEIEERVTYEGLEHTQSATTNGRGMIFAVGHFGNWELLAHLPKLFPNGGRATMFQSLGNPFINRHVIRSRGRGGVTLFDRNEGIFGPLKHIREGGSIAVLFDQHAGDLGTWCPLLGRLASTTRLPALMSVKSKVAMVAMAVHANGRGRWRIVLKPPIEPGELVPEGSNRNAYLTLRLNQAMEDLVRLAPEEWFWVHNRWKTPNPEFLLGGRKRNQLAFDATQADATASIKPFRLLVRSPNPLGDACMAIPAVRAMKRGARPDLQLTVLCRENLRAVWERVAEVDQVITIERGSSAWKIFKAARTIRNSARYDASVLLPNSLSSALECKLAGIPRLVGDRGHQRSWLINQRVPRQSVEGPPRHHAEFYLNIARHIGARVEADEPLLMDEGVATQSPATEVADALAGQPSKVIGLCPGAEYGNAKRWPLERYAEAVLEVHQHMESLGRSCRWHIFGSPNEQALAAELASLINAVDPVNRAGQTSIDELCDELSSCTTVLTNDTGTMHLAAAMGTPTVAIFGSTEPAWTAPLGSGHSIIRRHVECSPCFLRECPRDYRCMNEIDTTKVVEAVVAKL